MYWRKVEQPSAISGRKRRLRTKIVATIGRDDIKRFDTQHNLRKKVPYSEFFTWFVQQDHPDCFIIDVIRLNMAFYADGSRNVYEGVFKWLEKERDGLAKNVAVLCDLAGAKTRLGEVPGGRGIRLLKNRKFNLYLGEDVGVTTERASVLAYRQPLVQFSNYRDILDNLRSVLGQSNQGIEVSLGDGDVVLRVHQLQPLLSKGILECTVEKSGVVKPCHGVTFEKVDLGLHSFDNNDQDSLKYMLDLDREHKFLAFIGVSFVRGAKDILAVQHFLDEHFRDQYQRCGEGNIHAYCPGIIAKIETQKAVENIDEILDLADGVMIARGDLALQIGREMVPETQKSIITLCNQRGKVAITATQMLKSMVDNPKPTRAEATDVFNAIFDGTDAVMLSDETAVGLYPAQAIQHMAQIASRAEAHFEIVYPRGSDKNARRLQELRLGSMQLIEKTNDRTATAIGRYTDRKEEFERSLYTGKLMKSKMQPTTDLICESACHLAEEKQFDAIFVSTGSGRTVRMISRFRPSVDIIGIVRGELYKRKLSISYGVYPIDVKAISPRGGVWLNPEEIFQEAAKNALDQRLVRKPSIVIYIAGSPLGEFGRVNILQVKDISDGWKAATPRDDFGLRLLRVVDEEVRNAKEERIGVVSEEARTFIANLLGEAMRVRADEGKARGFPVEQPAKAIEFLRRELRDALRGAANLKNYETASSEPMISLISLISVVEWMKDNWCEVWPFCR